QVVSVRDLEEMLRGGKDPRALPADALLTPSARDFLRDLEGPAGARARATEMRGETPAKQITSKSAQAEIDAFFNSARLQEPKTQMCDIGRRLWQRAYVDGNGGNMA